MQRNEIGHAFKKMIQDPLAQLLVSLSILAYLAFLKLGDAPFMIASAILDIVFLLRIIRIAGRNIRRLTKQQTNTREIVDSVIFISTLILLFTMGREISSSGVLIYYMAINVGILLLMAVLSMVSSIRGKNGV